MLENIKIRAKGKLDNFLYSGFTTRKIKIEGKKQVKTEIKINYKETHNIQERNIVDISDLNNIQILNYTQDVSYMEGKKTTYYGPYQIGFIAMLTPKTCDTIAKIQDFWKCAKLSYRQAIYIKNFLSDEKEQKLIALQYYNNILCAKN